MGVFDSQVPIALRDNHACTLRTARLELGYVGARSQGIGKRQLNREGQRTSVRNVFCHFFQTLMCCPFVVVSTVKFLHSLLLTVRDNVIMSEHIAFQAARNFRLFVTGMLVTLQ